MKDIIIPMPDQSEESVVDISVTVKDSGKTILFKVETFDFDIESEFSSIKDKTSLSIARIFKLRQILENYDNEWELIQIYNPNEKSKKIQVLYRKK